MNIQEIISAKEDLSDALLWIDHREDDEEIVHLVAGAIEADDALTALWRGDDMWVTWQGSEFKVPHTISMHDRYVTISSLAKILEQDFLFYIETDSLGSDTHGLLIARKVQFDQLSQSDRQKLLARFTPLEIGMDYFSGIRIPYVGNPEANPDFANEAERIKQSNDALMNAVMEDPDFKQALGDLQKEMRELGVPSPQKQFSWQRVLRNFMIFFVIYFVAYMLYLLIRKYATAA